MPTRSTQKTFRFAPSPNGFLHLGHAYSALLNFDAAEASHGTFLLRIEDIDTTRCRPQFDAAIAEDLHWLGLHWPEPVLRQSTRMSTYQAALARLEPLLYPCFCTRTDLVKEASARDPNGAPLYSGTCKHLAPRERARRMNAEPFALRLDMARANVPDLSWQESGQTQAATPEIWGDVVIARKDIGTSYHLAVVVDDAAQNVSTIIRGQDLASATHIHRLLQHWLDLPTPDYQHHPLLLDETGEKLAKSQMSKPLRQWRGEGATPQDIRRMVGLTKA